MSEWPMSLWCSAKLLVAVKNYFSILPKVQGGNFLRTCTSNLLIPWNHSKHRTGKFITLEESLAKIAILNATDSYKEIHIIRYSVH